MKIKTVLVISHTKLRSIASSEMPAIIDSVFLIDSEKARVNMHQKENENADTYKEFIKNKFSEIEIKSMY